MSDIEFDNIKWNSLTKQMRAYNSKHKTKFNLKQFSKHIIDNPKNFHKKTRQRANFYKHVINPDVGSTTGGMRRREDKPGKGAINYLGCSKELSSSTSRVVFFGDRNVDKQFALSCGFEFIQVKEMVPVG